MGRLVAPEMHSQTLRRTKWVLNAHQGMEGAKNAYREFQEARRAEAPRQRIAVVTGTTGQRLAPPAKPNRTGLAATRLVGGRRPSVLQRWGGLGFSPDGFRLRSRRCRNRGRKKSAMMSDMEYANSSSQPP